MTDFQDAQQAPEATVEEPAPDTWESGPTERAQEQLAEEDRVDALYGDQDDSAGALERLAETPPEEPAPKPAPKPKAEDADVAAGDAVWTTEEAQALAALAQRAQAFQAELAQFAQLKGQDIDALAGGDKGKAEALKRDLKEWEDRLQAEYRQLQEADAGLRQRATSRLTARAKARLEQERQKLGKAFPDLDKKALRSYLTEQAGFTEQEVLMASDARLVTLAEKARRFDEIMANGGPKPRKVPVFAKGRRPKQGGEPEILPSMSRSANIFERMAAVDAMYPSRPARRRSVQSDDPAEILYGGR